MTTTIRRYGQSIIREEDLVVVHTDESKVRFQLRGWNNLVREVPYEQWLHDRATRTNPLGRTVVGVDMYFPATVENRLRAALKMLKRGVGAKRAKLGHGRSS